MGEKKRSFKEFLSASGNDGVKKVAIEYATENDTVTFSDLSDKYNLSSSGLKNLIEYAIVNCIISYKVALFIKGKAHRNQLRHCKKNVNKTPSDVYYQNLFNKRFSFVKNFDNEKVISIVDFYVNNRHLSANTVAESLGLSLKELNIVLKKAIIFDIIDDEKVADLKKASLAKVEFSNSSFVLEIFKKYDKLRAFYKFLNSKIAQTEFQLQTYDSFVSADEAMEHTKSDLEKELKKSKDALKSFVKSF